MEIEVGDYVKTKNGYIVKTTEKTNIFNLGYKEEYIDMETTVYGFPYEEQIVKHSKILTEVVEVGDIVDKSEVYEIGQSDDGQKWVHTYNGKLYYENELVGKTILTKEQYNANCYTVERKEE